MRMMNRQERLISPGFHHRDNGARYINFDPSRCRACWKCIEACPNQVFGKIDLFFHKHAVINHGDQCKGCQKCVKVCEHQAITSKINK